VDEPTNDRDIPTLGDSSKRVCSNIRSLWFWFHTTASMLEISFRRLLVGAGWALGPRGSVFADDAQWERGKRQQRGAGVFHSRKETGAPLCGDKRPRATEERTFLCRSHGNSHPRRNRIHEAETTVKRRAALEDPPHQRSSPSFSRRLHSIGRIRRNSGIRCTLRRAELRKTQRAG